MSATGPEAKIKKAVKALLKSRGIWHFSPANNGLGRSGIPDIIAIVGGRFVGIECKADKSKRPTTLQIKCGDEIIAAGGTWYLVYDEASIQEMAVAEGLGGDNAGS